MKDGVEALGKLVDVASDIEVGLAELAKTLDGDARALAQRLTEMSDGLADSLTAIYIELAREEAAKDQAQSVAPGSAGQ